MTFNVTGNPAGTTTNFSVNPVAGPGNTVLTIGNTGAAAPGAYSMTLTGAYTGGSQNTPLQLIVSNAAPGSVTLTAPANGATGVSATPTFTWSPVAQAASYSIQVATSPSFANYRRFSLRPDRHQFHTGRRLQHEHDVFLACLG